MVSLRSEIGRSVGLGLSQAPANSLAALAVGWSNSAWAGGALPFSLAALGAPGCSLLASTDLLVIMLTDGSGRSASSIDIPLSNHLVGTSLFSQYLVLDLTAGLLVVASSQGLHWTVGG